MGECFKSETGGDCGILHILFSQVFIIEEDVMASKTMESTIYIHKMPFRERQDLVDILNSGDAWRTLGGYYMKYDTVQLDKFALQVHKPGGSPADAMLSYWGQRNHTVLQLWKLLRQMRHFQAMESIKSLVPDSIWWEMNPQNTDVKTLESNVSMRAPPPPPTFNQAQANKMMEDNIDKTVKKDYSPKKMLDPTRSLNVSQWTPSTGAKLRNKATTPTEPINAPTNASSQNPTNNAPRTTSINNTQGTSMQPSSFGSILKQRNPSGIHMPDTDMFFANVPFEELYKACKGFHISQQIGKGGFGEVYKGRRNHQDIAVKRIRSDKRMDHDCYLRIINQFIVELQAMHTFPGENILLLLYYSFTEDLSTEPCLVYQYMPNGSVSDRLKLRDGTPPLTWSQRKDIAFQVAKGLCHLHGNKIVHGDIKSGNILLDANLKAYIGDFGLARGGPESFEEHKTVSVIIGTDWYLPDDYRRNFDLKYAVDTFCYGVFLFDLVTGRSPSFKDPKTNKYMREIMLNRSPLEPIDEYVDKNVGYDLWAKFLFCFGKDCTKPISSHRPWMGSVNDALESLIRGEPQSIALQKFYDDKNKKPESSDANRNNTGIPDIPDIVYPDIPNIVCGPLPVNENASNEVTSCEFTDECTSEYTDDHDTETEKPKSSKADDSWQQSHHNPENWDPELSSSSFCVIQEMTKLKFGD